LVKPTVTTSPTLKPGTRGGGLDAFTNSTPGQHAAAPALLFSPTKAPGKEGQATQLALDGAARAALYVPDGQSTQDTAWTPLHCPGGHGVRTPATHVYPGSQGVGVGLVLPSPHWYPLVQGPLHWGKTCATTLPYRPAGHST
jgi:hypothetical protein